MKLRVVTHAVDAACVISPFPASFGGDPWLFGKALAAILAISAFGLIVCGWMIRDLWRDRAHVPLLAPLTAYRMMVAICAFVAFLRSLPQLAFMTTACERDIHSSIVGRLLVFTRYVDIVSLPSVLAWMFMLIVSYPYVVLALKSGTLRDQRYSIHWVWPRLARPVLVLVLVLFVATMMAWAKAHGIGR